MKGESVKRAFWATMAVVALTGSGVLTSCGSPQPPPGPVRSLTKQGQVVLNGGGASIAPGGSAVVTGWIQNSGKTPVTFLAASLVPIKGFPVGRLTHIGIVLNHNAVEGATTWPPTGDHVPTKPLIGASITRRGQINIAFAMQGTVLGRDYEAAGLRIRYRYQGHVYSTMAWFVASACVVPRATMGQTPWCVKRHNQATNMVQNEVGHL